MRSLILPMRSLETPSSFCNSRTEHDIETRLRSIDFSCQAQKVLEVHGCKPSVTNSLIVLHRLGILTTIVTCCISSV